LQGSEGSDGSGGLYVQHIFIMRCLYFVSKWPQPNYSAGHERIYSLVGSLLKNKYEISMVCG
jgi:hypothetical protein